MQHLSNLATVCRAVIAGAEFGDFALSEAEQDILARVDGGLLSLPYGKPTEMDVAVEALAVVLLTNAFRVHMRQALPAETLAEVDRLNAAEPDDSFSCHTHDYCDANMVMLAAAESLGPFDIEKPDHMLRWSLAWDIAFRQGFGG